MSNIFKQMFTEVDNDTFDLSKILAACSVVTGLGLSIYAVVFNHHPFDMVSFGTGIGLLFSGVAVLLKFKKESNVDKTVD